MKLLEGTHKAMVFEAARDLCSTKRDGRFHESELVVECWKRWPEHFGLRGYSKQYPDSNRVYPRIIELMRLDFVVRVDANIYKVK